MASLIYNTAKHKMWAHASLGIDLLSDTIKCMLIATATAYTEDDDDDFVDESGANDPVDAEANVTNYTRGFAGAGRKTLASKTVTTDKTNSRAEFDCADITWTALGNATNQTIDAAILIKEITNDAASPLIAFIDFTDFTTNGSDFTMQFDAEGLIQLSCGISFPKHFIKKIWSWFSEKLNHSVVDFLKLFGIKPHIYRFIQPIRFDLDLKNAR